MRNIRQNAGSKAIKELGSSNEAYNTTKRLIAEDASLSWELQGTYNPPTNVTTICMISPHKGEIVMTTFTPLWSVNTYTITTSVRAQEFDENGTIPSLNRRACSLLLLAAMWSNDMTSAPVRNLVSLLEKSLEGTATKVNMKEQAEALQLICKPNARINEAGVDAKREHGLGTATAGQRFAG